MIELVSVRKLSKLSVNDKVNIGITAELEKSHRITEKRSIGSLGEIISQNGPIYTLRWENGVVSIVHTQIDMIREVKMPVLVYRPGSKLYLRDWEISDWANMINKSETYTKKMCLEKLHSKLCSCGINQNGYSAGVFDLMPTSAKKVHEDGIAYMVCRKCGETSQI